MHERAPICVAVDLVAPNGPLPLAAALGLAAASVVICAGVLSHRAALHPGLPSGRWVRPLPATLTRLVDHRLTRWLLRGLGIAGLAGGVVALIAGTGPVDAVGWWPVFTVLALLAGPAWRAVNPARVLTAPPGKAAPSPDRSIGAAAGWLFGLLWATQSTSSPQHVAVIIAVYTGAHAGLARRHGPSWHARGDALEVLADTLGHLGPIGRGPRRMLAWRHPLVATAQAPSPHRLLELTAVMIGASLTGMAASTPAWPALSAAGDAAARLAVMIVACAACAPVLRLGFIRPWLRSAAVPLIAAYGLLIGGWWLPPFDLLGFIALHLVAVAVAHRQAVARLDLRMARAVQFPLRIVLVASVVGGIALASAAG